MPESWSHALPITGTPEGFVASVASAPPAAPPVEAPAPAAGASSSGLLPRPAQDAVRILSEAEVFVKYGLLERAADHLRRLVELQPDHQQARARFDSVLKQLGRAPLAPAGPVGDPLADVLTPPPGPADAMDAAPRPVADDELTARVSVADVVAAEVAETLDGDLEAELEQIDFFIEQSLLEEARESLAELAARFPNHALVLSKMREMSRELLDGGQTRPDATAVDDSPGALPREEGTPEVRAGSGSGPTAPVAVMAAGGEADLSTHGDLGIAYKEMGLHDAAIAEFKELVADPARKVFALTMIGECFEALGALPDAVARYKEALNSEPVAEAESAQLYYLLGSAFERLGDASEALYFFEKVAKRGGEFRDVARRIEALKPGAAGAP
jgi:tetratricopeptide (TPR) repeat protein